MLEKYKGITDDQVRDIELQNSLLGEIHINLL